MAFYECTFICRHDMSPADVTKLTDEMQKVITGLDGKIIKTEQWGLRTLAYKINKAGKGHYVFMGLDCPHAALAEMERQMRINEDVIRILSVRVDEMDQNPTVVMKFKTGDSDAA